MAEQCPNCHSTNVVNGECQQCGFYVRYPDEVARAQSPTAAGGASPTASPATAPAPAPPRPETPLEFEVVGTDLQYVEIHLAPGQAAVGEAGAMLYMDDDVAIETVLGDGTQRGLLDTVLSAGKRVLASESAFMTIFTNQSPAVRRVAFSSPYPGRVLAIPLTDIGGELIAQKDAFLAAALGVTVDIAFQRSLGVGLFGGKGFIMERLRGSGVVFVNSGGTTYERTLAPGETLKVEVGALVAFQSSVAYDIQYVGNIKSALFGGEGLFFATLTGPGRLWLQSLSMDKLVARITPAVYKRLHASIPASSGVSSGGGLLGGVLGTVLGTGASDDGGDSAS